MKRILLPKLLANEKGKKKVSIPLFVFTFFLLFFCYNPVSAQVVNVTTALCFKTDMVDNPAYDGVLGDGDQITVTSLLISTGGSISYNDPGSPCGDAGIANDAAGAIKIDVVGNFTMQDGSAIYTENRIQSGRGGDITLTVGGDYLMQGGSLISSSNLTASSGDRAAGNIKINVSGNVVMDIGSVIIANSAHGNGGDIEITSPNNITINGHVLSQDLSPMSGSGNNQAHGGFIFIQAGKTLRIGDEGIVSSRGFDAGADLVHLCACDIIIYGLVESSATGHGIPSDPSTHLVPPYRPDKSPNSTAGVEIWASSSLLIDNLNHNGEVNADLCCGGGTNGESWIDIFVKTGDITIIGKTEADNSDVQNTNFAVHANGAAGNSDNGGIVTIKALEGKVTASGLAVQADGTKDGGSITMEAKKDVDLSNGTMTARAYSVSTTTGGTVNVRSFGTAPATGSIVATASSTIDVSGDVGNVVNLTACGTVDFPPGVVIGAVPTIATGVCGGNPSLASQPYVVFCGTGNLVITKVLVGFAPANTPLNDWSFTISPAINGQTNFTIPKAGGTYTFTNAPNATYTITEVLQADPSCVTATNYVVANSCGPVFNGNVAVVTVDGCAGSACTFFNTPPDCNRNDECQWCTKSAVLSQVWQNPGGMDNTRSCLVPDILVDVRLPHTPENNVVTADEIGTGVPATWSIQAAIDYANAHKDDLPLATNPFRVDEIFIGVTASDEGPIDPTLSTSCGKSCGRALSGDNPKGVENVIVTNESSVRMNIFGCSVTMTGANANAPVFTIQNSTGKVTILDLHVWNNNVAGYLIKAGNADRVTVKNSAAYNNDIGYIVEDNNVEITGSQHIINNRIGLWIAGTDITVRTVKDITGNKEAGILVSGSGNVIKGGNVIRETVNANSAGILVTGNNNQLEGDEVTNNANYGIKITGNNNYLKDEEANDNGNTGIYSLGTGNSFEQNDANDNGGHGILACNQIDLGGNSGSGNTLNPQIDFACIVLGPAKFVVTDISADKAFKYDADFNLISSSSLTSNNGDANDVANDGTKTYVLDVSDKQVYSYVGATATASKVLKSSSGGSLSSPAGIAISGTDMWVADNSLKKIYRYNLGAAFPAGSNLNAVQEIAFTGNNGNAGGLIINGGFLYVLDNSDKQFYRYATAGGAGTASKVMKQTAGASLGNPTGATVDGANVWVVDNGTDRAYSYSLVSLFSATGNLNAATQKALNAANGSATGVAIGSNGNLPARGVVDVPIVSARTAVPDMVLNVFPNPAHDKVLVQFSSSQLTRYTLNVLDATGRLMMSHSAGTTEGITVHEFDVSKLAKGSYLIVLQKGKLKKELKKLIVQ